MPVVHQRAAMMITDTESPEILVLTGTSTHLTAVSVRGESVRVSSLWWTSDYLSFSCKFRYYQRQKVLKSGQVSHTHARARAHHREKLHKTL